MFDIARALSQLTMAPLCFRTMWDFLEDRDAVDAHLKKWKAGRYSEGVIVSASNSDFGGNGLDQVRGSFSKNLKDARSHYAHMMLVTAYTHLEDIVLVFLHEVFRVKPQVMIELIKKSRCDSSISLEDLIGNSKEEILERLAKQTASQLNGGGIRKVCERIKAISKTPVDEELVNRLYNLQEMRNFIVHEAREYELDKKDVEKAFEDVKELLGILRGIAIRIGVELVDDYWDEADT